MNEINNIDNIFNDNNDNSDIDITNIDIVETNSDIQYNNTDIDENKLIDISIEDFITDKLDIDDKGHKQRNSNRDIKKVFIDYCTKYHFDKMIIKFTDIKPIELSQIINKLGYIEEKITGRNYKNDVRKNTSPSYNINLSPIS